MRQHGHVVRSGGSVQT